MTEPIKVVKVSEHPIYVKNKDLMLDVQTLISANPIRLKKVDLLWEHPSEQLSRVHPKKKDQRAINAITKDRQLREQRTQYINFLKMIRNRYTTLIMKGGLDTSQIKSKKFLALIENLDGKHSSLDMIAKQVTDSFVDYGVAFILTDMFMLDESQKPKTEADKAESNLRPYWEILDPILVKDWNFTADFKYTAIRFEYEEVAQRTDLVDSAPEVILYSKVFKIVNKLVVAQRYKSSKEGWIKDGDPIPLDPSITDLPIAVVGEYASMLKDAVPIALKIYNKDSDLDNILYNQGYDKEFILADLSKMQDSTGDAVDSADMSLEVAVNTLMILPEGSDVKKLEVTDTSQIAGSLEADIAKLFKIAFGLISVRSSESKEIESAETQESAKEALITMLQTSRKYILQILNTAIQHFNIQLGDTSAKDLVSFKEAVSEKSITDLIEIVSKLGDRLNRYPTATKQIDRKIIGQMHLGKDEEIDKEIESAKIEQPQERAATQRANLRSLVK